MPRRARRTGGGKSAPRNQLRVAHRSANRTPARKTSINWERLGGRWAVWVIALMLLFYIAPVKNYLRQRSETAGEKIKLQQLLQQNHMLRDRAGALSRDSVIELEARRMGMVRANERPFVVLR